WSWNSRSDLRLPAEVHCKHHRQTDHARRRTTAAPRLCSYLLHRSIIVCAVETMSSTRIGVRFVLSVT
ncbi:MAG: hypothetical protein NTU84_10870, partial [Verrucomicrobia bacterium]|nr:hypothetical protein [Verrucomicrobiota bacterium]